jgi:predicted acetyltransferase
MSALRIARPQDFEKLDALVAAFHAHAGIKSSDEKRYEGVMPLLQSSPHGVIYLIGPASSPVGYIALAFNWSIEYGGLEAIVDEFFIRDKIRGRGMGREALHQIMTMLRENGVKVISLETSFNSAATSLFHRIGFVARDNYGFMVREL